MPARLLLTPTAKDCMIKLVGVVEARWSPRSSKPLVGSDELAMVGSTPIHSRQVSSETIPDLMARIIIASWCIGEPQTAVTLSPW
jgi:hypothetical protein